MEDLIFNLEKDEPFNLEKLEPGIKDIYVGLSWDPATAGEDVDLDAVLVATNEHGFALSDIKKECFLYFNNHGRMIMEENADGDMVDSGLPITPKAYMITEDNTDGEEIDNGIPDDEAIFIRSDLVNERLKQLRIFVTYYKSEGKTLSEVNNITLTIAPLKADNTPDLSSGKSAVFNITETGTGESMYVAKLVRNTVKGWDVVPVSEQAGNLAQIVQLHKLEG